ncbi:endolytic transglycosylase MltG [Acidisphaera sp. L21]|uniref:endolytic transglycosylase MltG n=1 Tax=Acidisphaera sp. L21 TaxID=1641851 RepID=UPI00131DEC2A|nr:endolytic transglycosylase MltG [Acidisphaera sp. L21]
MRRVLLILLLLIIMGVGGAGFWLYRQFDAPGPLVAAKAVVVPRGGFGELGEALQQQGVIDSALLFRAAALATLREGPLHAAELSFPAGASLRQVLVVLRTGRAIQHHLTIPEGLTAAQIARLVDAADGLSGDTPVPAEGTILPETYSYERGTSREQLMDRARTAMDRALQKDWDSRAPGLPLLNKAEALVLASMVERETAKPEERPIIAAVFLNRLRQGMKLQSDPTVVYGASGGLGVLDHPITRSELDHPDPYNTYRIPGLPPGPICVPGQAALRAAMQPAASDALFFVADGTGGHVFARTQEDHLRNVAHWRDIERARAMPPAPVQQ